MKLILDTDIGSDIDDAICLAYLLARPDCELLGITTVTGQAVERAKIASALCRLAGRHTPILPGAENPLLVPQQQPEAPQAAALAAWPHETSFPRGQAVEFLRQTIRQFPGEVTLLTIGPLTNIALLFKVDPDIPALLRALVMMAGVFTNRQAGVGPAEWNARLDPHATAIVYGAPVAAHRSVGLDVTSRLKLGRAEVQQRFQAGLLRPVLDFAGVWFRQRETITFHDPLAALCLFEDDICTFERGRVEVELLSDRLKGVTSWSPDPAGPHQAALEVDEPGFFKRFFAPFAQTSV